ncbi:putative C-_U-editing enzyme APOBEC-4 [Ornithorhynchus anatinus]|uniref:Apolipoprotein B mRNA editing enzyme catalytic polypeptide like 4 n=1 Tax=Ornithorhynchus anatinus TaxID=9258 RepID=F6VU78_ORNAN|nr:putative C->U-editing enzyme APOBEC-4 [Ornithorhynchus anatinus]
MESFYQEYLASHGTVVKPYYWLTPTLGCSRCPYHIRTGEEARVPYREFYQTFGFPHGPMFPQPEHLTFYELKTFSGAPVQKGQATSCVQYSIHPESMLFEEGGYLDSVVNYDDSIGHIILFSNYTPCNEAGHCCISQMFDFLMTYPDITLSIYFSQLYHTENDFPASPWNRKALRSLASLSPRVSVNPISGGIWHALLRSFVSGISGATLRHPVLPSRALADGHNAYEINAITGVKPYFTDVLPQVQNRSSEVRRDIQKECFNWMAPQWSSPTSDIHLPPLPSQGYRMPVVYIPVLVGGRPQLRSGQSQPTPQNVVRHLKMPQALNNGNQSPGKFPPGKPIKIVEVTERRLSSKKMSDKKKKREKDIRF